MTAKDLFCGLARAGGKALNGIGTAAVAVLREADFQEPQESDSEQYGRETLEYGYKSTRWWSVPDEPENGSH